MSKELRVLILGMDQARELPLAPQLESGGFSARLEWLDPSQASPRAEPGDWDLALLVHPHPTLGLREALAALGRAAGPVPRLVIALEESKDRLEQVVAAGAAAAIPVSRLEELGPAVAKALQGRGEPPALPPDDQRYRLLVEHCGNGTWWLDAQGIIGYVNLAAAEALGCRPEDLVGRPFSVVDPGCPPEAWDRRWGELRRQGQSIFRVGRGLEGSSGAFMEVDLRRVDLDQGESFLAFTRDTGHWLGAEASLGAQQQWFEELFQSHRAAMCLVEPESLEIVQANPAAVDFYGYPRGRLLGMKLTDLNLMPEPQLRGTLERAAGGGSFCLEHKHRLADGGLRDVEVKATSISLGGGRPLYFMVLHDVTARRQAEKELRESEQRHRLFVESSRDGVAVVQDGRMVFANPAMRRMLGYDPDQPLGRDLLDSVVPEDRELVEATHQKRMRGEEVPQTYEFRVRDLAGRLRWLEVSGVVAQWHDRPAALNFVSDITGRKQAEQDRLMMEKLQAAITTAGTACHELNQPLQAALSQTELLLMRVSADDPIRAELENLLEVTCRVVDITRRLNNLTGFYTRRYLGMSRIEDQEKPGP